MTPNYLWFIIKKQEQPQFENTNNTNHKLMKHFPENGKNSNYTFQRMCSTSRAACQVLDSIHTSQTWHRPQTQWGALTTPNSVSSGSIAEPDFFPGCTAVGTWRTLAKGRAVEVMHTTARPAQKDVPHVTLGSLAPLYDPAGHVVNGSTTRRKEPGSWITVWSWMTTWSKTPTSLLPVILNQAVTTTSNTLWLW